MYFQHIANVLDFFSLLPFSNALELCVNKFFQSFSVLKLCLYFTIVYFSVFVMDWNFKLISKYFVMIIHDNNIPIMAVCMVFIKPHPQVTCAARVRYHSLRALVACAHASTYVAD